MKIRHVIITSLLAAISSSANAANISVSFTNAGNSDFFLTPLWVGLHDGTSDTFDSGSPASAGLELLAEEGMGGTLTSTLPVGGIGTMIGNPAGFGGAPIIDPGETATATIAGLDTTANRYFNYASMLIPTNDAFIANGNPTQYELFDSAGNFTGPITITILANQIWDAGTEVNDAMGAPFSMAGGTSTDEGGNVSLLTDFSPYVGIVNGAGSTVSDTFTGSEVVATITIVPEPSASLLLGVAGLTMLRRRRS